MPLVSHQGCHRLFGRCIGTQRTPDTLKGHIAHSPSIMSGFIDKEVVQSILLPRHRGGNTTWVEDIQGPSGHSTNYGAKGMVPLPGPDNCLGLIN